MYVFLLLPLKQNSNIFRHFFSIVQNMRRPRIIVSTRCGIRPFTLDTGNKEQLFDRGKTNDVMPKNISGDTNTTGAVIQQQNVRDRRVSVWGRLLSIICKVAGKQVGRPIGEGPSTAGPATRKWSTIWSEDELRVGIWNKVTTCWKKAGVVCVCVSGYNKGIWIHAAYHTHSVADSTSQMALIKDVHQQPFLSYRGRRPECNS